MEMKSDMYMFYFNIYVLMAMVSCNCWFYLIVLALFGHDAP
jgi:hypothetical protein